MSARLPIGSGMHRAKRNRSRGPRPQHNADRDAFLSMAALRSVPNPLRKRSIKSGREETA